MAWTPAGMSVSVIVLRPSCRVRFNTTRGGTVSGDAIYREYHMVWQAPPLSWPRSLNFPVSVSDSGGDLYNRKASVLWPAKDPVMANAGKWSRPGDAIVHMMHNGWGNVQYRVQSANVSSRKLHFAYGGFQHGRGGGSGAFYVENVTELLDAPGEWHVADGRLRLWPNSSSSSPATASVSAVTATASSISLSAAVLESIVVINGTREEPVTGVTFSGVGFSRTAPTYLRPYVNDFSINQIITELAN